MHSSETREIREKKLAAILSLVVGLFLMLAKFWAFNITGSQSVYSDAMESIVNIISAAFAIFVIYYASKPIDEDHPYGHGKVEYFSSTFEGGLIAFASILIIIDASRALILGHELRELDVGLAIVVLAGLANLLLGLFLIGQGKKNNSLALVASGRHVISDFYTSAGITIGLGIVYITEIYWLDSAVAIIVGLYLGYTGYHLVRESIGGLMDEEDIEVLTELAESFEKSIKPWIIQLHHVKVIRAGDHHHIDAHIVLPEYFDVAMVHNKVNEFENEVIANYKTGGEMNFHMDPCRRAYCKVCSMDDCQIRAEKFERHQPITVKHMRSKFEPNEYWEDSDTPI